MKKTIIILLVIVLLLASGYVFYSVKNKDINKPDDNIEKVEDEKENILIDFEGKELAAIGVYPQNTFDPKDIAKKITKSEVQCYELNNESDYYILVIPRFLNTTISLYSCDINENGEVVKGEKLLEDTKPYIAKIGTFEYIPRYLVEVKPENSEAREFPITFSGFDGSVVYGEYKNLIHDVSEGLVY